MRKRFRHSLRIHSHGFGLIEVLIAVAVVAGIALMVASFVSTSTKSQVQVREKAQCEAAMSAVIDKLKETDNNAIINNWLPKSNEGFPPTTERYMSTRMSKMIFNNFTSAQDVLNSTVLATVGSSMDGAYTTDENNLRLSANNYQLIYSTSSLLSHYYRTIPNICEGVDFVRRESDFLSEKLSDLDPSIRVFIKLNLLGSTTCSPWDPIPQGVHTPTGTVRTTFDLMLKLFYPTENGEQSCSGNATFYVGSELQAPQLDTQLISAVSGFNELPPTAGNRVFCGPNANPTLTFNVSQLANHEKPGIQYLCRLDYEGRQATTNTIVHPFRSTGWFLCSIPARPIEAMSLPSGALDVLSTSVSDENQPAAVQFVVGNWSEGTYKFHVKAIDLARNETLQSQKFYIDSSRPNISLSPPSTIANIASRAAILKNGITNLPNVMAGVVSDAQRQDMETNIISAFSNRLYQCTNDFSPWSVSNSESLEVTATTVIRNYHAGTMPVLMSCNSSSENIPTTAWSADGPHMVQAIACDLCGNGNTVAQTWYVDTGANFSFSPNGNLDTPTGSFVYNAGPNDQNPYALVHEVYGSRAMTAHMYQGTPIAFPAQSGINGACTPNQRGRYCYYAADGCGRIAGSNSERYQVGAGGGNSNFCPTFSCAEPPVSNNCPAARPNPCTCTNDSPRDLNFSTTRAGRYAGDPANPGCTYEENLGTCCSPPRDCTLEDGTPVAHGTSITAFQSTSVSCGQICSSQVRTCNNGILSGSSSYGHVGCTINCCPTGRVHCTQGSPGCIREANGAWCAPEDQCPSTHSQGPFANELQCSSVGNIDCQLFGAVYCGRAVSPTPTPAPGCSGSWGPCSQACGGGTQTYTLTEGASCSPAHGETRACNLQACPPVQGKWCRTGQSETICGSSTEVPSGACVVGANYDQSFACCQEDPACYKSYHWQCVPAGDSCSF